MSSLSSPVSAGTANPSPIQAISRRSILVGAPTVVAAAAALAVPTIASATASDDELFQMLAAYRATEQKMCATSNAASVAELEASKKIAALPFSEFLKGDSDFPVIVRKESARELAADMRLSAKRNTRLTDNLRSGLVDLVDAWERDSLTVLANCRTDELRQASLDAADAEEEAFEALRDYPVQTFSGALAKLRLAEEQDGRGDILMAAIGDIERLAGIEEGGAA